MTEQEFDSQHTIKNRVNPRRKYRQIITND
jgi:hypothetical protein